MKSKPTSLDRFHNQMLSWRAEGLSFQQIAERLQASGMPANKGKVYRYFKNAGLSTDEVLNEEEIEPLTDNSLAASVRETGPKLKDLALIEDMQPVEEDSEGKYLELEPKKEKLVVAVSPVRPVAERFPEIDCARDMVSYLLHYGLAAESIQQLLQQHRGIQTSIECMAAYIEGLLEELYPPGPINPALFEVAPTTQTWPDEMPILKFGEGNDVDTWTLSDFTKGTLILGGVGCGKTTGSMATIAAQFISNGFGGIIFSTKAGDIARWTRLVAACKREHDFVIIQPGGGVRFNPLHYETTRPGVGKEFTENIVAFIRNLASAVGGHRGQNMNEHFWRSTGDQLIRNTVKLILMSGEALTLDLMCEVITNAPLSSEQAKDYPALPIFGELMLKAQKAAVTPRDLRTYRGLEQYWLNHFPSVIPPETRGCITLSFGAMVDGMRDHHIYESLSTYTNIAFESIFSGKIVYLDFPVNEMHEGGLMVQCAWKYAFERAVLRRGDHHRGDGCRPVFMWEDEGHNYLIDFDGEFMRVAREYRVCRVLGTQNINNLYDRFGGGGDAKVKTDSLLGNLNTRVFHANGDLTTNTWAADSLGTVERKIIDTSSTPQVYHGLDPIKSLMYRMFKGPIKTTSTRTVREPLIHPHEFLGLAPGGKKHNFVTEAIVSQVGRTFSTGNTCRKVAFRQILLG